MKPLILSISILFSFSAAAQGVWKTTVAEGKYLSATLLLTKADGSIITIPDPWKVNIRQEGDKINIIYPDSTRVIYRIGKAIPPPTPGIKTQYGVLPQGKVDAGIGGVAENQSGR